MVRECHQSKDVNVEHIQGIIIPSNIFSKEMNDKNHFRNIRDTMIVSLQNLLKYHHNIPSHIISAKKIIPYYSIFSEYIVP